MRWVKLLHRRQRGQVIVLTAFLMVVLLGFAGLAIDVGRMTQERRNLQNAMDAAALAGARELPDDPLEADVQARDYAGQNGVLPAEIESVVISNDNTEVTVTAGRQVSTFFMRVLGIESSNVQATATARVVHASTGDVFPWLVPEDETGNSPVVLKIGSPPNCSGQGGSGGQGSGGNCQGNFGAVDLTEQPGGGNRAYVDAILAGGFPLPESCAPGAECLTTEPGNMGQTTFDALEDYFGQFEDRNTWPCDYADVTTEAGYEECGHRLILVPLVEEDRIDLQGSDDLTMSDQGLALMQVLTWDRTGPYGQRTLTGQFVTNQFWDPSRVGGEGGGPFAPLYIKLVK